MLMSKCVCDFTAVAMVLSYIDAEIHENKKALFFSTAQRGKG
jgi:hypothetical protein